MTDFLAKSTVSKRFCKLFLSVSLLILASEPLLQPAAVYAAQVQAVRLVILPFRNLTRQANDDWLGESFAESLTMGLLKVDALQVIERGQLQTVLKEQQFSQSAYADEASAPKLGKLLGANVVVLGSFQKVGDQLQANVRFVDVETGKIDSRRSAQIQGKFEQIFDLQKQLANDLVKQLEIQAKPEELAQMDSVLKSTQSTEAYKLYMQGRQYLNIPDSLRINKAIDAFKQALNLDPEYVLAMAGLAEAYAYKARERSQLLVLPQDMEVGVRGPGDAALARRYANQALEKNPDLPEVLRALSVVEMAEGNQEAAADYIKQSIKLNPKDSNSLMVLVQMRFEIASLSLNIEQLSKELSELGASLDDPWVQFTIGAHQLGLESMKPQPNLEASRKLLMSAHRQLPDNPYVTMTLMALEEREGHTDQAEAYFKQAYDQGKDSPELVAALSAVRLGQQKNQEAYVLAKEAYALSPSSVFVRLMLADCLYAMGQKKESEAIYLQLRQEAPASSMVVFSQGLKYFVYDYDFEKSKNSMSEALELWKKNPDGQPRSLILYFLAICEMATNDYEPAKLHFTELLKDPIYYGQAYEQLATIHGIQENYEEALAAYTAYLTIHPQAKDSERVKQTFRWHYLRVQWNKDSNNVPVLNDLGQLALARKTPELAESFWKHALEVDPKHVVVMYNLGSYYSQSGKAEQALPLLEKAVQLKPDYVKAWYNLGLAYQTLGRIADARQAWQTVLSLEPSHAGATQALKN